MISLLSSYACGNAASILLNPPLTTVKLRILRNLTGTFTDQNSATLIYEGTETSIVDTAALDNGIVVYYKPFYYNGTTWTTAAAKSITPNLTIVNRTVDVLSLVRDRLDLGLNALVTRGDLKHPNNIIPVLTASPQIEDTVFPIVTVHLTSDNDETHFIGDMEIIDQYNLDGTFTETSGWLSQYTLEIVVWSLNGDERKQVRSAMKSILQANIPIFSANEMEEISLQYADQEDFQSYNAPIYMANCTMRCLAPSVITDTRSFTPTSTITVLPII
jgi:Tfp pilus assembly protein PilV